MFGGIREWTRDNEIHWGVLGFIAGYHLVLAIALPMYLVFFTPSAALVLLTFVVLSISLVSITMGYHRLYSHRTFDAHPLVEWVLIFFGTATLQGSIVKWSHDHRLHHKHVDGEKDPYSIQRGFWHAHMVWLFYREESPMNTSIVKDLLAKPLLRSQHEYFGIWATAVNVILTIGIGLAVGDLIGAIVFVFLLRLFLGHHSTWFINSLAHMWGSKPYSTEHSAVNNFVIAILTYGEGYHNYHHTFAGDYRNGIKWYQYDPSKLIIWLLSKIGLTRNLKRVNELTIQKRLVQADRNLMLEHLRDTVQANMDYVRARGHESLDQLLHAGQENIEAVKAIGAENMERLRALRGENVERLREQIEEATVAFNERVKAVKACANEYTRARSKASRQEIERLRQAVNLQRDHLKADWRAWQVLTNQVLNLQPVFA
jgi:stearoyl-CoA desaturase (Delta-9 desaturase)